MAAKMKEGQPSKDEAFLNKKEEKKCLK